MNVLILTEGGRDIGFGHITRCTSIYQAFEEKGFSPELIVNGDATVQHLVSDKRCRMMDWLNDRGRLYDIIKNTDIVFFDSYLADLDLYEKISNMAGMAVYFDDYMRIDYPKGFVLNGAIFAEQMPYPKTNGITYLLGARYATLRKEFWDVPPKPIRDHLETVMVTFGGTSAHNLTLKILKRLIDTHSKLLKKVIVLKSFQNIGDIEQLKDSNTELIYHPNAAEMKEVMLESDIAISAGGQTLFELARVGVPPIVVTIADNQFNNARSWEKVGFIEYAGQWDNDGVVRKINQGMQRLKSKSFRQQKSTIGREVVDGTSSSRTVKEVLSSFYKSGLILRRATLADAQDVFNLANDDAVRKGSFDSDPIAWSDHLGWLRAKLGDNNCYFFIVDSQGEFAGQVRFDIITEGKEAEISVSLQKQARGLRLSTFVISRSIKQLLKACKGVKVIKAYIKQSNTASVKCFEEAGFKFLKSVSIKGQQSGVYEKVNEHDQK